MKTSKLKDREMPPKHPSCRPERQLHRYVRVRFLQASPLHLCCQWGLEDVVRTLLEHGASINAKVRSQIGISRKSFIVRQIIILRYCNLY